MKRWLPLLVIVAVSLGAVWLSEHRDRNTESGPNALLHIIGDTQREASRVPAKFTRISDDEEIAIGNELAASYLAVTPIREQRFAAQQVQAYVTRIGMQTSAHTRRKLPYRFHYIADSSMVNAFALPGGHVFIGEGLLSLMRNEDELAAVLGHEVEHVDLYHCVERVQFEAQMRKLNLGVAAALASIPISIWKAGYSKEQELEADREGTRLAVFAGYSPQGAISLFRAIDSRYQRRYKAADPAEEMSRIAIETLEGYFRSHPLTEERIANIQRLIASQAWEKRTEQRPLQPEIVLALGVAKKTETAAPPRVLR